MQTFFLFNQIRGILEYLFVSSKQNPSNFYKPFTKSRFNSDISEFI